jgi:uncharacterized protein (TIGR02145 family)
MKIINYSKYFVLCIVFFCFILSCKKTDQNGFEISTIKLGDQTWMSANLSVDKFNNGDMIKEIKTKDEWRDAIKSKTPAWCYYDNNVENGKKYGKIYNWYAISDPRGLAPDGWHIPNNEDWLKLVNFLDGIEVAGTKMKSMSGWKNQGNGSNESGFNGLPGGYRFSNGSFNKLEKYIYWWSSTDSSNEKYWNIYLRYNSGELGMKEMGDCGYVRCVKN